MPKNKPRPQTARDKAFFKEQNTNIASESLAMDNRRGFETTRAAALKQAESAFNSGTMKGEMKPVDKYDSRYNYKTYKYDYYSGTQAKVFFGDIFVDDIITIQYNISQSKQPIYGYASQNFDAVAMGTVIGNGSITIAFKETGYLNIIKNVLDSQRDKGKTAALNSAARLIGGTEENLNSNIRTTSDFSTRFSPNVTPSLLRKSETIENILDDSMVMKGVYNKASSDFEDIAEGFEDSIWGDSNGRGGENNYYQILRADQFDFKFDKNGTPYGVYCAKANDYSGGLNIVISFGEMNDFRAEHTLTVLNDVHFTGQGMVISPDGQPIAETYEFFFRDKDQSIAKTSYVINPAKINVGDAESLKLSKVKDIEDMLNSGDNGKYTGTITSIFNNNIWKQSNITLDVMSIAKELDIDLAHQSLSEFTTILQDVISFALTTNKIQLDRNTSTKLLIKITKSFSSTPQSTDIDNYLIFDQIIPGGTSYRVNMSQDDFTALDLVRRSDFFDTTIIDTQKAIQDEINKNNKSTKMLSSIIDDLDDTQRQNIEDVNAATIKYKTLLSNWSDPNQSSEILAAKQELDSATARMQNNAGLIQSFRDERNANITTNKSDQDKLHSLNNMIGDGVVGIGKLNLSNPSYDDTEVNDSKIGDYTRNNATGKTTDNTNTIGIPIDELNERIAKYTETTEDLTTPSGVKDASHYQNTGKTSTARERQLSNQIATAKRIALNSNPTITAALDAAHLTPDQRRATIAILTKESNGTNIKTAGWTGQLTKEQKALGLEQRTASGAAQFTDPTWETAQNLFPELKGKNKDNLYNSAYAAARLLKHNETKSLLKGNDIATAELHAIQSHNQGSVIDNQEGKTYTSDVKAIKDGLATSLKLTSDQKTNNTKIDTTDNKSTNSGISASLRDIRKLSDNTTQLLTSLPVVSTSIKNIITPTDITKSADREYNNNLSRLHTDPISALNAVKVAESFNVPIVVKTTPFTEYNIKSSDPKLSTLLNVTTSSNKNIYNDAISKTSSELKDKVVTGMMNGTLTKEQQQNVKKFLGDTEYNNIVQAANIRKEYLGLPTINENGDNVEYYLNFSKSITNASNNPIITKALSDKGIPINDIQQFNKIAIPVLTQLSTGKTPDLETINNTLNVTNKLINDLKKK